MELVRRVSELEWCNKSWATAAGVAGASVCAVGVGLYYWRRRWVEVGLVTKIYIHPLKSGQPLVVEEVECNLRGPSIGPLKDRGFMVANTSFEAVVLRGKHHHLVLVELTQIEEGMWRLTAPGMEPCLFEEPSEESVENSYRLLDIQLTGLDCGEETAKWISSFLGDELRLVKHFSGDVPRRPPRPKYCKIYPQIGADCVPAYADVTPYMLTTQPSLDDLNTRLPAAMEIDHRTFRPNFVISGPNLTAWQEDCWTGELQIGEVVFTYNKPCTRCIATKVNPTTGTLYEDQEPLKTLKTFRQHDRSQTLIRRIVGDSPLFGMHYSLLSKGMVHKGDTVWVRGSGASIDQGFEVAGGWRWW